MKPCLVLAVVIPALLAPACGVPRATRTLAAAARVERATLLSDSEIRDALRRQAPAWQRFHSLLRQREFLGIPAVSPEFVDTVGAAAAVARRQADLIEQGADDPAANRAMLERFDTLWRKSETYLAR